MGYKKQHTPAPKRRRTRSGAKRYSIWIAISIALVALLAYLGYRVYTVYHAPAGNAQEMVYLYVRPNSTLSDVLGQLQTRLRPRHPRLLNYLVDHERLAEKLRPGRYAITPQMTTSDVVNLLASGQETPVRLKMRYVRTEEELKKVFTSSLMLKVEELDQLLSNQVYLDSLGYDRESFRSIFMVGEYEVSWHVSARALIDTLLRHHARFWTEERRAKAEALGLTTAQVSALAAIVEEESNKRDEYSRIAGLYINRLKIGMPLQSDPTVKFALGDFSLRRILNVHLQAESPYNTYQNSGLTPGPIRVPRPETLDYVLQAEQHNYLYMVAKEDFSGYHNFASDYNQHLRYARAYQQALNARGIK